MSILTALPIWLVVALVALLPALEASTLLGLVIPGELAVVAGGVVAHTGAVPLWLVIAAAVGGAVVGDQVGYRLGRRYGLRLLTRVSPGMARSPAVARATELVRRRGAIAVLLGRWAAVLRALVPGVAGLSGVSAVRFTLANVAGGALWGGVVAVAGYLAGASYSVLVHRLGLAGDAMLGAVVLVLAAWLVRQHLAPRGTAGAPPSGTRRAQP